MRLLNVDTLRLESFPNAESVPPYAILSHRWEEQEVLFEDLQEQPYVDEVYKLTKRLEDLQIQIAKLQGGNRRKYSFHKAAELKLNGERTPTGLDDQEDPASSLQRLPSSIIAAARREGWSKVKGCCEEAQKFGIGYIWVDTCCIDQRSSSELSECVNSMFTWYRGAKICIAYLSDVTRLRDSSEKVPLDFNHSQWFRRGWTLQELIAPKEVWFFDVGWRFLGVRSSLAQRISTVTRIDEKVLKSGDLKTLQSFSVATRLSWAAGRETTRPEDRAYSLLGLFGVHMPTVYGEGGEAAFFRLQNHIFQTYPDHSILAWQGTNTVASGGDVELDLFARSPDFFESARSVESKPYAGIGLGLHGNRKLGGPAVPTYSMFNGLRIQLLMRWSQKDVFGKSIFLACLACQAREDQMFLVTRLVMKEPGKFKRLGHSFKRMPKSSVDDDNWSLKDAYIFSPVRDLSPTQHGHVFASEYLTVVLKSEQLKQCGLELGASSWPMTTEDDERSFQIRSNKSSAMRTGVNSYSDIVKDQPKTEKSYGGLVFRLSKTGDIFAVILSVIASQVKTKIVKGLTTLEFRRGYLINSLQGKWPDLSLSVVSEVLNSGQVIFLGSTLEKREDGEAMILRVGIQH